MGWVYIVFKNLGQTPNRWASWLFWTHPYLNACKVLPYQMLLLMQQESRQMLSYLHLPSASPLNNITCPHLTSAPRQMGYAVLWLAYTSRRQAGSTLTSTWGPIFLPQIPWKFLPTCLWSWSKGEKQAWAWLKAWTHAQNGQQIFLLCDPTLYWGDLSEVFCLFCKVWDNLIQ